MDMDRDTGNSMIEFFLTTRQNVFFSSIFFVMDKVKTKPSKSLLSISSETVGIHQIFDILLLFK